MHFPTLSLGVPPAPNTFIAKLLGVFTFDYPKVNYSLFGPTFAPPANDFTFTDITEAQADQMSTNLRDLGYGSAYASNNLGSAFLIFFFGAIGFLGIILLVPLSIIRPFRCF